MLVYLVEVQLGKVSKGGFIAQKNIFSQIDSAWDSPELAEKRKLQIKAGINPKCLKGYRVLSCYSYPKTLNNPFA